ncbi:regulator of chromosome condensation 1/beta-lactamase-inhibitor protein II, partial [Baffinella frigidus]
MESATTRRPYPSIAPPAYAACHDPFACKTVKIQSGAASRQLLLRPATCQCIELAATHLGSRGFSGGAATRSLRLDIDEEATRPSRGLRGTEGRANMPASASRRGEEGASLSPAPSKGCARRLASMRWSGARAVGGTRVALALLALAALVGVAAGLDACPAAGGAAVSPCAAAPACTISVVRGGEFHTCALSSLGGVRCWGRNNVGQLGRGNTDTIGGAAGEVASLADVPGAPWRGARVGVGSASAALRRALALNPVIPAHSKCWGGNHFGELGLDDTLDRGDEANEMGTSLPSVDLGAGWTVVEVAAGGDHTCARLENGAARALKCWGYNNYGQLGLGSRTNRGDGVGLMGDSLPAVELGTGRWALALALGDAHSCALLDDASV